MISKLEDKPILKFLPNTLEMARKDIGLDRPATLEQSLDILEHWIKKQQHFVKKDFSRDYIERTLLTCKGSVEKAKLRFDKSSTIKGLLPQYFESLDANDDMKPYKNLSGGIIPNLTENNERIYILSNTGSDGGDGYFGFYKFLIKIAEYIKAYDYSSGIIVVLDYSKLNLMELLQALSLVELRKAMSIVVDCYGLRIKRIHIISASTIIEKFVSLLQQILSSKMEERIYVHKNYEDIRKVIPKELLPEEYGGAQKSLADIYHDTKQALLSEEFINHLKKMYAAKTNEDLRNTATFNEQYLGTPGSFRTINVD